jgi:hypothetical protein
MWKTLGVLVGALALVKLVSTLMAIGFVGIPGWVLGMYANFVDSVYSVLLELPFGVTVPDWLKHGLVLWGTFAGSNWRFLTKHGFGESILTGIGDVGRGTRRGSMSRAVLLTGFVLLTLSGPIFTVFVLAMWLGNRTPGPSGLGRWGDKLMIGNRSYTVRIAREYLVILALSPLVAATFVLWNMVG